MSANALTPVGSFGIHREAKEKFCWRRRSTKVLQCSIAGNVQTARGCYSLAGA
jgi:hypothetical protein